MKPTAQCRNGGNPIGIFDQRRRHVQGAVLAKIKLKCLAPCDQAVMTIGWRQKGKKREGLSAKLADAATNPDPVVMFVMGLFVSSAMADDGIVRTLRTLPGNILRALRSPVLFRVASFEGAWDK